MVYVKQLRKILDELSKNGLSISSTHPVLVAMTEVAHESWKKLPKNIEIHILNFAGFLHAPKKKAHIHYKRVSYQNCLADETSARLRYFKNDQHFPTDELKYIYLKNGFLENAFRNSANSRTLVGRASCMIESLEIWTATHQERQSLPLSSSEEAVDMERCLKTNLGDMSIPYYHRWPKYWHLTEYSPAASIMSRQIVLPIRIKREYFPKGRERTLLENSKKNYEIIYAVSSRKKDESYIKNLKKEAFGTTIEPCTGSQRALYNLFKEFVHQEIRPCNMRPSINIRYKKSIGWCIHDDVDWMRHEYERNQVFSKVCYGDICYPKDKYELQKKLHEIQ